MISAIMQPYFFPHLAYFQLMNEVDMFVMLDDVQYMRHHWINRNRIRKPGGDWQYIIVPVKKHPVKTAIKDVLIDDSRPWARRIYGQLECYKHAPFFEEAMSVVAETLGSSYASIGDLNFLAASALLRTLGIRTSLLLSSEYEFDYSGVKDAGDWALHVCEQLRADEYINPINGKDLFDPKKFEASGIKLSFFEGEPGLSIIDTLMEHGVAGTKGLLCSR